MKIRYNGLTSFKIDFKNASIITDPIEVVESGLKLDKTEADVVLMSAAKHYGVTDVIESTGFDRVSKATRERLIEITGPGEYEAGQILMRRDAGQQSYMIDGEGCRIVFLGFADDSISPDYFKKSGNVDILIVPVGEGEMMPSYEKLEKVISYVDPNVLIPCGYKLEGMKDQYSSLNTLDQFLKHFGYGNIREEKTLNYTGGSTADEKMVDVVVLKS